MVELRNSHNFIIIIIIIIIITSLTIEQRWSITEIAAELKLHLSEPNTASKDYHDGSGMP